MFLSILPYTTKVAACRMYFQWYKLNVLPILQKLCCAYRVYQYIVVYLVFALYIIFLFQNRNKTQCCGTSLWCVVFKSNYTGKILFLLVDWIMFVVSNMLNLHFRTLYSFFPNVFLHSSLHTYAPINICFLTSLFPPCLFVCPHIPVCLSPTRYSLRYSTCDMKNILMLTCFTRGCIVHAVVVFLKICWCYCYFVFGSIHDWLRMLEWWWLNFSDHECCTLEWL